METPRLQLKGKVRPTSPSPFCAVSARRKHAWSTTSRPTETDGGIDVRRRTTASRLLRILIIAAVDLRLLGTGGQGEYGGKTVKETKSEPTGQRQS